MTQEEEEDHNTFANDFHHETVGRLQLRSLQFKPEWDLSLTMYGVLCSHFLQRLLSERFPNEPEKQKKWRTKIDGRRDELFGNPSNYIDSRPGPSGIKRSLLEKSPSPPKKF